MYAAVSIGCDIHTGSIAADTMRITRQLHNAGMTDYSKQAGCGKLLAPHRVVPSDLSSDLSLVVVVNAS